MSARSHLQLIYINPGEADDRAALNDAEDDGAASGARLTGPRRPSHEAPGPIGLEEAFKQYAPHVAAIGFRILGSRDQMQDLVQDVFLKAYDWIARIDDPRALK